MPLFACQNEIPVIATCPPAGSKVLLFDVTGSVQYKGMALMDLATFKCCMIFQMFGAGILTITGSQLVLGIYQNTSLVGELLVFADNIQRFLKTPSEWIYVRNGNGVVVGIEIFIGYLDDDEFQIFPNPSCTGTPAEAFPDGINETVEFRNVAIGRIDWTSARRSKYGRSGSFEVFVDNGTGIYKITSIQGFPDDVDNPSYYDFDFGGNANSNIIIA